MLRSRAVIKKKNGMVDRAVDAVGYQAVDKGGNKEQPNIVLDQLIMVTRPTGGLGIPGERTASPMIGMLDADFVFSFNRSLCAQRSRRTRRAIRQRPDPAKFRKAVREGTVAR